MKPLRATLVAVAALLVATAHADSPPEATAGSITFVAENAVSTANGTFHAWRVVSADIDRADPASGFVEVEVDVASVDTGIERRDEHLRTADFFEVERWPTARVVVRDVVADGESEAGHPRYRAKFDITIRDVEKTLDGVFEVTSESPPTVEGGLTLDRLDFGIGEPETWWNPMSITEEIPVRFSATFP
jgi:polyisoprenoid-binding protein YceI